MRRTSVNGEVWEKNKKKKKKTTTRRGRRKKEFYWRQTNEWDQWQQFSSVYTYIHSLSLLVLQFFPLYGQNKKKNSTRKRERERKRKKEKERRTRVHIHTAKIVHWTTTTYGRHACTQRTSSCQKIVAVWLTIIIIIVIILTIDIDTWNVLFPPHFWSVVIRLLIMYEMKCFTNNGLYPTTSSCSSTTSSPDSLKHQRLLVAATPSPPNPSHPYFPQPQYLLDHPRFHFNHNHNNNNNNSNNSNGSSEIHSSSSSTTSSHDQLHSWFVAQSSGPQAQSTFFSLLLLLLLLPSFSPRSYFSTS